MANDPFAAPLPQIDYSRGCLADVLPAAIEALTGRGDDGNPLGIPASAHVVVLLVDGLGWRQLRAHPEAAPFLTSIAASPTAARPIVAGFPTTTATSITSLGTGLRSGEHGLVGYSCYLPEAGATVNWLAWRQVGAGADLREVLAPEVVQPRPTAFEQAAAAGVAVSVVSPDQFDGSGLTRAALRGGDYSGSVTGGDAVALAAAAIRRSDRSLVYCYTPDLDLVGHVRGPGSDAWLAQLSAVDGLAEQLADRLPSRARLLVTGDHGMVHVADEHKVDFDSSATLRDGVVAISGEPRTRYLHTRAGAAPDVLAAWQETLGDSMWVLTGEQAVAAGWYGDRVAETARSRIGDIVATAVGPAAVVRRSVESRLSALAGQHGALTDDELLVPLLQC